MPLYVQYCLNLPDHPKFRRMKRILTTDTKTTSGILVLLWRFAAEYAPDGNLSKFPPDDIGDACDYPDGQRLVDALVQSGFCDAAPLSLHDWPSYRGDAIRMRATRDEQAANKQGNIANGLRTDTERTANDVGTTSDKVRLGKVRLGKVRNTEGRPADAPTASPKPDKPKREPKPKKLPDEVDPNDYPGLDADRITAFLWAPPKRAFPEHLYRLRILRHWTEQYRATWGVNYLSVSGSGDSKALADVVMRLRNEKPDARVRFENYWASVKSWKASSNGFKHPFFTMPQSIQDVCRRLNLLATVVEAPADKAAAARIQAQGGWDVQVS